MPIPTAKSGRSVQALLQHWSSPSNALTYPLATNHYPLPGSHSPQLSAEAFTDMFSWFPFATSITRPEQRADFTPAGNFCKHVFCRCGRLAICQPFSDVLLYGTCREEFALPRRRGGRDAPDRAPPRRRPAGDVRALRPVFQGGLCGGVAGAAGCGGCGRCAAGRILAAMAQPGCLRCQPGKPGGMAGGDYAASVHRPPAQAAAGDRHRGMCDYQRS